MSMYGKKHYNIVISFQLIKIKGKKKRPVIKGFNESCLDVVQTHPLEEAQLHSHTQIQGRQMQSS